MKTLWITGAGGLIGSYLIGSAPRWFPGTRVVGLTREQLDLTDAEVVEQAFQRDRPELVIHCAAMSRSPDCQANPVAARAINVTATATLSGLAADCRFFFLSSDLVFDGRTGNYDEIAGVNPLSVYAETKVEAEAIVLVNPRHTVIRTSLNGGKSPTGDRGFDEQMKMAWRRGERLRLFTDEYRCPISAQATADAILELAVQNAVGIFHVAGRDRLSRWEIGGILAERCPELSPRIEPASLWDYPGAPRPPDTSLNCSKAQKCLSFQLPRCRDWLGLI